MYYDIPNITTFTDSDLIRLKQQIEDEQKRREDVEYDKLITQLRTVLIVLAEKYPDKEAFPYHVGSITWKELNEDWEWCDW